MAEAVVFLPRQQYGMPYLQYDPIRSPLRFGFFVCRKCGHTFYGGGCAALHASGCTEQGYGQTIYVFGERETWALLTEITKPTPLEIARAVAAPGTVVELRVY